MTMPHDEILILRITHIDNLPLLLYRGGLHATNNTPDDGLSYKLIHHQNIQQRRSVRQIPCGPRGVVHDYVPFYFGMRSPMLYSLKNGYVEGYNEGQDPIIYLVSTVAHIVKGGLGFVFSDGNGATRYTEWSDDLSDLDKLEWDTIYARYWSNDRETDPDRKRRKQAEFLVHQFCPWDRITRIAVINNKMKATVEQIFANHDSSLTKPVVIERSWYY